MPKTDAARARSGHALLLLLLLATPRPAHAFAPEVGAALAGRLAGALPPSAGWEWAWNAAAASRVEERLAIEDTEPERWASAHRFDPGAPERAVPEFPSTERAPVAGDALIALEEAATALREGFARHDPFRIVDAAALVAACAADLADPFQTTPLERDEEPGARFAFCDAIPSPQLAALEADVPESFFGVRAAGEALARQSAGVRPDVEDAVRSGDRSRVEELRRERLEAALALARAVTWDSWRAAGEPTLIGTFAQSPARVSPNPVRASAAVAFSLAADGDVHAELFDLAGRRVWSRQYERLLAGPQALTLGARDVARLPVGIYLVRISGPGTLANGRLTRVSP